MNNKKDITDLFRDRLKDYDQPIEDNVWARIDHDLKEKKSTRYWIRKISSITSAAMFVLILGLTLLLKETNVSKNALKQEEYTNVQNNKGILRPENNKPLIAEDTNNSIKNEKKDYEIIMDNDTFSIKENTDRSILINITYSPRKTIVNNITAQVTSIKITTSDTKTENITNENPDQTTLDKKSDQPIAIVGDTISIDNVKSKVEKQENLALSPDFNVKSLSLAANKNKYSNVSYALAIGNSSFAADASYLYTTKSSNNESPLPNYDNEDDGDATTDSPGVGSETEQNDPVQENITLYKEIDVRYKMPVIVSFSVRKHLTDKWALESGLTYSYLSSTETYDPSSLSREIHLNYLGIPLKAIYSFYNYKNFSVYIGAGGMGEMCVSGRSKYIESRHSSSLGISEIQWSVFGNVGVNYRLINHLGLFVEPGLSYYFDDGSGINTIRKDKPFNFNIQAGLRLSY